jgi:hypothetical protein
MQGFRVGDLAGYRDADIFAEFLVPIVCNGGRWCHIILQVPVGTATATEIFRGDVFINGYFE